LPFVWSEVQSTSALTATRGVNIAGSALINDASKIMASGVTDDMGYQSDWLELAVATVLNMGRQTSVANSLFYAGRILTLIPRRVSF
jgi:hypothetical protein